MSSLRPLDQPVAGRLTIQPTPKADSTPTENPPRFAWIPDIDAGAQYALRLRRVDGGLDEIIGQGLRINFFTPDRCFEPGRYVWSYALWSPTTNSVSSGWSDEREFEIAPGLTEAPAMRHQGRYADCNTAHPRLWLNPQELDSIAQSVRSDGGHLGWTTFFESAVKPWIDRELIAEPQRYPGNKRTPALWRKMYIDCQELLYAVRHLAVCGSASGCCGQGAG